jgi:DNA polymerase I
MEWREVSKLLTTYVDALPPLVDPTTGRIHTTLSQTDRGDRAAVVVQPEPAEHPGAPEEGREIRRAFVPGEGFAQLLVADYSQIELRIMAHLSGDEGLLDAFGPRRTSTRRRPPRCSTCRSSSSTARCATGPRRSTTGSRTG